MPPVAVRILHPEPDAAAGPLTRWVADARADLAERHRRGFLAVGAEDVETIVGPPDARSFGERLRGLIDPAARRGLVVLGSGAVPLAVAADRRAFVMTAALEGKEALANNRYSADIVAIARADALPEIPALPGDNALPRWLEEVRRLPNGRPATPLAARFRYRRTARSRPPRPRSHRSIDRDDIRGGAPGGGP